MNTIVVLEQMIIIFILIAVGYFLSKSGHLSEETSKNISFIVINITNPLTLISSALSSRVQIGVKHLFFAIFLFVVMYAFLFIMSLVTPCIIRLVREERFAYGMLLLFSNVGFIGIPFVSAVLGADALIYVSICCLVFNLVIYTYGMSTMRRAGEKKGTFTEEDGSKASGLVRMILNTGTVSSLLTIVIFALNIKLPQFFVNLSDIIGRGTTFLSMIVVGAAASGISIKMVFGNAKLYLLTLVKALFIPIILAAFLKQFDIDETLRSVLIIMSALPSANMPLMYAREYGAGEQTISAGIILTTLLSVLTIPAVVALYNFM